MSESTRRLFILGTLLAPGALAWQKKGSQAKGPEIELISSVAKIEDQRVNIDVHIRNVAGRPIKRLHVIYEILDSDKKVLTRQKGPIDEDELANGVDAEFSSQMQHHARAVYYRLEFEDGSGRDLRSEKTGPFPIE